MEDNHKSISQAKSVEETFSKKPLHSKNNSLPISSQVNDAMKKNMEKSKEELETLKKELTKKYKFIEAMGVIPAQAAKKIEEEYEISAEESKKGLIHILTIVPEKQFKNIKNIRLEIIKMATDINKKFWVHVMTPVDIWNLGLDSKFQIMEALSMSYPLLDKSGFLGSLRVTQLHKSLVLKKFEKYVTSYVIAGSLPRGEATKTSDVDIFIVIDDTDVKRMSRLELKEKLRGIIQSYIQEAQAIAGVKNILNVQTYLMTEFWDSVKDAHPVMFTFIRDGIPIYDRGAFLPWKSLLRMGKIKPSPEAIDMFMSSGNKLEKSIERRILDVAVLDIYWGVLTPSQGILMLFGLAPSTPKETIQLIREVFFEKEKILEEKYVKIIESIVRYYKSYEHGKHKKMTGTMLDEMAKNALDYIKRLKQLRKQIDKRVQEKSIQKTYEEVFGMLGSMLKKKTEAEILKEFDIKLIKTGKFPKRFLENTKFIAKTKKDSNKKDLKVKPGKKEFEVMLRKMRAVEDSRKFAAEIINTLIEYNQRCEFSSMERTKFLIKGRDSNAEVFFLKDTFLVEGPKIQKVSKDKLIKSNTEELKEQLISHKDKEAKIDLESLKVFKKIFGEFDLIK